VLGGSWHIRLPFVRQFTEGQKPDDRKNDHKQEKKAIMCLANNRYPRPTITFSGTIELGAEILNEQNEVEHLLGYSMQVQSTGQSQIFQPGLRRSALPGSPTRRSMLPRRPVSISPRPDFDWDTPAQTGETAGGKPVGNAMLIAIPAMPGTVTAANLIPVSKYPNFMLDYARAVTPQRVHAYSDGMRRGGLRAKSVEVVKGFDNGLYDVLIASSTRAIISAIKRVDEAKRPQINSPLYKVLDKLYGDWTFILFCFEEAAASKAGCALVRYKPVPEKAHLLYLPGLDGHNGEVETGKVELDHTLVVGSYKMNKSANTHQVVLTDRGIDAAIPFLPQQVIGTVIPKGMQVSQGDFLFSLDEVRKGTFRAKRALPPGWEKVFAKPTAPQDYIEG
jgi:hypothetical protein